MTLGSFLDAGYALIVDEYRKSGLSLFQAADETAQWRAGGERRPEVAMREVDNEASLQQLEAMRAGLK